MADKNQKSTSDNFDKEFSLNQKSKNTPRGKLPSWIMILAGAAMITGVVLAKPPANHPAENGTKTSVTIQTEPTVVDETVSFGEVNDQKADPSEVEAFFGGQSEHPASIVYAANNQAYNMNLEPLRVDSNGYIIPSDNEMSDAAVYWIDKIPYAVRLAPSGSVDMGNLSVEGESVYSLGEQDYSVRLTPLSEDEAKTLSQNENSGVIRLGEQAYQLIMEPKGPGAQAVTDAVPGEPAEQKTVNAEDNRDETAANANTGTSENGSTEDVKPAVAWLNDKPYSVTVSPWQGSADNTGSGNTPGAAQPGGYSSDSSVPVLSVTVLDEEKPSAEQPKTVVFDVEGTKYEAVITKLNDPDLAREQTADPIVWIDTTPLEISLDPVNKETQDEDSFDVILNSVSDEKLPKLLEERYGDNAAEYLPKVEDTPETIVSPEPEQETPQEETQPDENWFVGMFHNIFGSNPTETPVPQVTVVAVTPTAVPVRPTQTPIVVRVEPTEIVQEPVRLDAVSPETGIDTGKSLEDDLNDPALWDDGEMDASPTPASETAAQPAETAPEGSDDQQISTGNDPAEATAVPTAVRLVATVVTENEELPHTGMAESWNIPSMLALLAGLLLLIIGIRRLRSRE